MSLVFLDTVALIAIWNHSDQWHTTAKQTYLDLRAQRAELMTTRFVLLECGNAVARTAIRHEVTALRRSLAKTGHLIGPTEDDWNSAWEAYDRSDAAGAGIVDLTSFAVMRRLGIMQAFTNDRHFTAAGFETLF